MRRGAHSNLLGFIFTLRPGLDLGVSLLRGRLSFRDGRPFWSFFVRLLSSRLRSSKAHRGRLQRSGVRSTACCVFGVPLVGVVSGLSCSVRDVSTAAPGAPWRWRSLYGLLSLRCVHAPTLGLALLARAFLALPRSSRRLPFRLAFDYRITAALWSVAAAAAFWARCAQSTPLLRGLRAAGGVRRRRGVFSGRRARGDDPLFANAVFVGAMLIALSGIVTAAVADRAGDTSCPRWSAARAAAVAVGRRLVASPAVPST